MANQTLGVNIHTANPYSVTVTNSGTLIGSDIELVINLSTVTSKQDVLNVLLALQQFYQQSAGVTGEETMGAAPP